MSKNSWYGGDNTPNVEQLQFLENILQLLQTFREGDSVLGEVLNFLADLGLNKSNKKRRSLQNKEPKTKLQDLFLAYDISDPEASAPGEM